MVHFVAEFSSPFVLSQATPWSLSRLPPAPTSRELQQRELAEPRLEDRFCLVPLDAILPEGAISKGSALFGEQNQTVTGHVQQRGAWSMKEHDGVSMSETGQERKEACAE